MTPTKLTLRELKARGYVCEVVERWNPHARVRHDLFGFVDVIAIRDGETLAVQATSASNVSVRVSKIADHENVGAVRKAGWSISVWGWRKVKKDGKRTRYVLREVDLS